MIYYCLSAVVLFSDQFLFICPCACSSWKRHIISVSARGYLSNFLGGVWYLTVTDLCVFWKMELRELVQTKTILETRWWNKVCTYTEIESHHIYAYICVCIKESKTKQDKNKQKHVWICHIYRPPVVQNYKMWTDINEDWFILATNTAGIIVCKHFK